MDLLRTLDEEERSAHDHQALPFFSIWTGQAFSIFGSHLVQFSLIWWLTVTTGSATILATASIVSLLSQIFLGPVAGAIVDRGNCKAIMMIADALVAVAIACLAVLLFWATFYPGRYILLIIMIMATLINLVLTPAFSLLPLLVKNDFGGGALQLAWVESAGGIGIIFGGVILSAWAWWGSRSARS